MTFLSRHEWAIILCALEDYGKKLERKEGGLSDALEVFAIADSVVAYLGEE